MKLGIIITAPCLSIRGKLIDSHCNSSSAEAGVLIAIAGHDPIPPEGGTYYHWWEDSIPPHLEREPAYLSAAAHIPRTRGAPRWEDEIWHAVF
ncbi:hypothetical protein AVEN_240020-1 [Araneus ventricosus]|uniref:Uncharacterized protein n=1 Tax=Araneus ventricosus TaxID=182803 RepID=A0A4Y2KIS5_ARAVE|nr:hypothetical protein AVEN_240020-1 [Araneus ventricosus]